MKTDGEVTAWLHAFITSVLDGGISLPALRYPLSAGGSGALLDAVEERIFLHLPEIEPSVLVVLVVACALSASEEAASQLKSQFRGSLTNMKDRFLYWEGIMGFRLSGIKLLNTNL
jgi:hypothetical protein